MYKMMSGVPDYVIHWENYDQLYYKGDYTKLIELQKAYVKKHPADTREKLLLADAYNYAGRHKSALKILKRLHRFDPYDTEITHTLVECLDKLAIDPKTFKWLRNVQIFDGSKATKDWCYAYLKEQGVSDDAFNIHYEMSEAGYTRFDEDGLLNLLREDERFRIHDVQGEVYPVIELSEWALIHLPDGLNTLV